jgi:hypothetical protein
MCAQSDSTRAPTVGALESDKCHAFGFTSAVYPLRKKSYPPTGRAFLSIYQLCLQDRFKDHTATWTAEK